MLPNTKISGTIMEFGKGLINSLPQAHTRQELEATLKIIITVWNSLVIDKWHSTNSNETMLLASIANEPKFVQLEFKRLVKRKKKKFADDIRAVGNHWIREERGEYIFGCEARLDIENMPVDKNNPIQ